MLIYWSDDWGFIIMMVNARKPLFLICIFVIFSVLLSGFFFFRGYLLPASDQSSHSEAFSSASLLRQYPALKWLADDKVMMSQEGKANDNEQRYSMQLFSQAYDEFDRTVTSLECLSLVRNGSDKAFLQFVHGQRSHQKPALLYESFKEMNAWFVDTWHYSGLSEDEFYEMLQVGLIMADLGKSVHFRKHHPLIKEAVDHDQYLVNLAKVLRKQPDIIPAFYRLSVKAQALLLNAVHAPHYGHISHLEGGPELFLPLTGEHFSKTVLSVSMLLHIFDVAGARGHMQSATSITYGEQTHRAMKLVYKVCEYVVLNHLSVEAAYTRYLSFRGQLLGIEQVNSGKERVLVRLACMMRLFSQQDRVVLNRAFEDLPESVRKQSINVFNLTVSDPSRVTPTYMPAVLINLIENKVCGNNREARLYCAVTLGVPLLLRALALSDKVQAGTPLCFNNVAGIMRSPEVYQALQATLRVNASTGMVILDE